MSNALAIASVTAILKNLLDNALIDRSVSAAVSGQVKVTALPPDRVETPADQDRPPQLNLFLYHVSPNAAWRNTSLPARGSQGDQVDDNPLALDLHYLLTAYGNQDFEAEILLGYAMHVLHQNPVFSPDVIRKTLATPSPVTGAILPPAMQALSASDLADQIERVRITPEAIGIEEISKLWPAFQARYRPTVAYQASLVLIQGRQPPRPAMPVRARGVYVVPARQPRIDRVISGAGEMELILAGGAILLVGADLKGDGTKVSLAGSELEPAPGDMTDRQILLLLPANLPAGVHTVQVVRDLAIGSPPQGRRVFESNAAAFVLHPTITASVSDIVPQADLRAANVTVQFTPPVGRRQKVLLLLSQTDPLPGKPAASYGFVFPPRAEPDTPEPVGTDAALSLAISGVKAGKYLVRVQVDGAQSPVIYDPDTEQYAPPEVSIS